MISAKAKAILLVAVMYLLGVASGVLWRCTKNPRDFRKSSTDYVERRVKKLTSKLNLSPEQQTSVRAIVQKSHDRAGQVRESRTQEMAEIHRESVQSMRAVLTPEQTEKFEKMHRRFHAKRRHFPADDLK